MPPPVNCDLLLPDPDLEISVVAREFNSHFYYSASVVCFEAVARGLDVKCADVC